MTIIKLSSKVLSLCVLLLGTTFSVFAHPNIDLSTATNPEVVLEIEPTDYPLGKALGASSNTHPTERVEGTVAVAPSKSVNATLTPAFADGDETESKEVTAASNGPSAPKNLKATPGDKQVTLTWKAPENDGGSKITKYQYKMNKDDWTDANGNKTTYIVKKLKNGTEYTFKVRAVNKKGDAGAASDKVTATPTATPNGPSAPKNLKATPGDKQVTLTWKAPENDGGSKITKYQYKMNKDDWTDANGNKTTYIVKKLKNGTEYTFKVRAVNKKGDAGAASDEATATPIDKTNEVPSAPKNLKATPSDKQVKLTWKAPENDGGSKITKYQYKMNKDDWTDANGNKTTYIVKKLKNGTEYTFKVRAVNKDKEVGAASAAITVLTTSIDEENMPTRLELFQNYPNPFNPSTTINYSMEAAGAVTISVYNLMGQKVATLVNEMKTAGNYSVRWNATGHASGMYYYRLEANGQAIIQKMTLIK